MDKDGQRLPISTKVSIVNLMGYVVSHMLYTILVHVLVKKDYALSFGSW